MIKPQNKQKVGVAMHFFTPFELPSDPMIPAYTVNIKDFGAVAGGEVLCSEAIARAIADLEAHGGGHLVVPAGVFLTGAIHFCSNMDLHLVKGAELLFTTDPAAYLPVVFTRIEGVRCYNYSPLLYAYEKENLSVTGEGILNGQGRAWWGYSANRQGMDDLYRQGAEQTPVEQRIYGDIEKWGLRPYFLQFVYCKNILVQGVRFVQTPFWCVAPLFSENITVRGVSFYTDRSAHNSDSVDFDSCRNCLMEDCHVLSSSDDGVCAKSGRDRDGRAAGVPTVNVEVRNCVFEYGGAALVVGSETSGGIDNVWMHDCVVRNSGMVAHVKSRPGRGGEIKNVDIENVHANRVTHGVRISTHYFSDGKKTTELPDIHHICYANLSGDSCYHGVNVTGEQELPLHDIVLKDIRFGTVETGITTEFADNLLMDHVETYRCEWYDWKAERHNVPYPDTDYIPRGVEVE